MNQFFQSKKYVTCPCQHCGWRLEFDRDSLAPNETCTVDCPHCGAETVVFLPRSARQGAAKPTIDPPLPPTLPKPLDTDPRQRFCPDCERAVWPEPKADPVNWVLWIFSILTFFVLVPVAMAYSLWRSYNPLNACPHCNNRHLVPVNSPRAQRVLNPR